MDLFTKLAIPYKITSRNTTDLTKPMILKNYLLICVAMFFFLTATNTIGGLQSTINKEGNLGLASSSVVFSLYGVSALFVPQLLTSILRFKWAFTLGFVLQLFYVGLNAYPKWYTYMPASALSGIGQALAFTCSGSAVLKLCLMFSQITDKDPSASQALFFGIYGIFLQLANVLGNFLIAIIFQQAKNAEKQKGANQTFDYSNCGSHFCPSSLLPPSAEPAMQKIYILVGVVGLCVILAIAVALLLNDIDYSEDNDEGNNKNKIKKIIFELKKQIFQMNQLLVVPCTLLCGYFLTFLWVDFTRSFAACSAGIDYIGWAAMILYAAAAFFSPIFGQLATKFTVVPVFLFYWLLTVGTCVWMLFWRSDPSSLYNLFLLAFLLGTIESINTPLPRTLYALIFKTEAIYASFTFIQGMGMLMGFLITAFCCTSIKIYVLIGLTVLSFLCCSVLYYKQHNKRKYETEKQIERF